MPQQLLSDGGMLTDFGRSTAPWANVAIVAHNNAEANSRTLRQTHVAPLAEERSERDDTNGRHPSNSPAVS